MGNESGLCMHEFLKGKHSVVGCKSVVGLLLFCAGMYTNREPAEPCCVYKSVLGLNLTQPGALDEQVCCPRAQVCWLC